MNRMSLILLCKRSHFPILMWRKGNEQQVNYLPVVNNLILSPMEYEINGYLDEAPRANMYGNVRIESQYVNYSVNYRDK